MITQLHVLAWKKIACARITTVPQSAAWKRHLEYLLCWELDGFDDPLWGQADIIAPPRPTTARLIEAGTDWIRPDRHA
jgi:hypothetical protein